MTTGEAKRIIKAKLAELGLPDYRLSARTIDFTDLARATCIFVRIHGWQPNAAWDTIRAAAVAQGFRIEAA